MANSGLVELGTHHFSKGNGQGVECGLQRGPSPVPEEGADVPCLAMLCWMVPVQCEIDHTVAWAIGRTPAIILKQFQPAFFNC